VDNLKKWRKRRMILDEVREAVNTIQEGAATNQWCIFITSTIFELREISEPMRSLKTIQQKLRFM
jgi:hypothetical protein